MTATRPYLPAILCAVALVACGDDSTGQPNVEPDAGQDADGAGQDVAPADAEDASDSAPSDAADADVSTDVGDGSDAESDADADGSTDVADADAADGSGASDTVDDTDTEAPLEARVVLNEVNCEGADFIELYNAGTAAADLAGWVVNDDLTPETGWPLPMDARLEPGTWAVWYRDEDVGVTGFPFGVKCGSGGDTIRLFDPAGTEVDTWELTDLGIGGAVHGRLPDGADWGAAAATPGAANIAVTPPDVEAWFDPEQIRRIDIVIPDASVENLAAEPRTWTPATLALPDEDIGPLDIGIRIKGQLGSFRTLDGKSAFRIDLNRYVAGQTLYGLEELTLNNMVQDPSMLHEFTAYSIFRNMGIAAPRVAWVQVTVNGLDYGLYLTVEGLNGDMLARWFTETTHLYEGAYGQDFFAGDIDTLEVDEGSETDRADVATLVGLFETEGVEGFYAATETLVDWDQVVRMLAAEVWIGHWDGYGPTRNNYYFHFDGAGRLSLLPWGTDQTFSWYWPILDGQGLVFQACLASEVCRAEYLSALRDVSALVETLDLRTVVEAQATFIRDAFIADSRREYDLGAHDAVLAETLSFLENRGADIDVVVDCLLGPNPDPDDDGALCAADCAPDDGAVYPGAFDVCGDGIDQDCNGYADDDLSCPDCVERTLTGGTYLFCPNLRNFVDAGLHCAANGAAPIRIDTPEENEAVWLEAISIRDQWWWIGLSDRDEEGVYRWADGAEATFLGWADGEPNNSGGYEHCIHYYDAERWNDIDCEAALGVICERE
jgi:hypothetical protein